MVAGLDPRNPPLSGFPVSSVYDCSHVGTLLIRGQRAATKPSSHGGGGHFPYRRATGAGMEDTVRSAAAVYPPGLGGSASQMCSWRAVPEGYRTPPTLRPAIRPRSNQPATVNPSDVRPTSMGSSLGITRFGPNCTVWTSSPRVADRSQLCTAGRSYGRNAGFLLRTARIDHG